MNRCYNCKYWATQDEGYSNYTVVGTIVHCLKNKFEPTSESYSWKHNDNKEKDSDFFKQAEKCEEFKHENGIQISLDVEGDTTIEDFKADIEVYEAANLYKLW